MKASMSSFLDLAFSDGWSLETTTLSGQHKIVVLDRAGKASLTLVSNTMEHAGEQLAVEVVKILSRKQIGEQFEGLTFIGSRKYLSNHPDIREKTPVVQGNFVFKSRINSQR